MAQKRFTFKLKTSNSESLPLPTPQTSVESRSGEDSLDDDFLPRCVGIGGHTSDAVPQSSHSHSDLTNVNLGNETDDVELEIVKIVTKCAGNSLEETVATTKPQPPLELVTSSSVIQIKEANTRSQDSVGNWRSLMTRMQQNQQKAKGNKASTNSGVKRKGSKRSYIKSPASSSSSSRFPVKSSNNCKRPKLIMSSTETYEDDDNDLALVQLVEATEMNFLSTPPSDEKDSYSVSVPVGISTPPMNTRTRKAENNDSQSPKYFNIKSGFGIARKNPTRNFLCSFNNDEEDFSNVLGWESLEPPTIIELNCNAIVNDLKTGTSSNSKRACPFYKKIPGTRFVVDAFNYGLIPEADVYFLSHFHSDHYIGLSRQFSKTLICESGTGNLVRMKLGVDESCIRRLQLNRIYLIQGVKVVLINANHCPGSVMFIFQLPNGRTILHTGDFRFTSEMLRNPFLQGVRVDSLYLDTTYCDTKYNFPRQKDTISEVVSLVMQRLEICQQTLVVCGAYCIGKERVFFSLAEAMETKVYCAPEKFRMLQQFENSKYNYYMSTAEVSAQIHVLPMRNLHEKFLSDYLAHRKNTYTELLAIKPSGWEFSSKVTQSNGFSIKKYNNGRITLIGLPYSEHSSFSELRDFVTAIKPKTVQPTVGVGSEAKRNMMMGHISSWLKSA